MQRFEDKDKRRDAVLMLALIMGLLGSAAKVDADETALDRYVKKPDPTYSWKVVNKTTQANPSRTFVVHLTSQTWRTAEEVNRTKWEHWLTIVKPEKLTSKTAFLMISGGGNDRAAPERPDSTVLAIAEATNSVVVDLKMIPNQTLIFHGDGVERKEDDLIGYTWDQFLKTGDETWPARLPMVKSVVRAMDCVQELLASEQGGQVAIENFVLAGASKRGWTTWCTAAVDPRVVAAIPIVIDVLNVDASMRHHGAVYGFYSRAVGNYYQHNIFQRINEPRLKQLYAIEDPYSYRDRLTMPKYIVNATGDQFFLPDSSQFYFNELSGEKHLRYVPNADHSLRGSDALPSLIAFYQMVLNGKPRPEYSWTFEKDGSIHARTKTTPKQVNLWQATNPNARDFRLDTIGKAYTSRPLTDQGDGLFVGKIEPPAKGWTAFFVEFVFDSGTTSPLKVTTAVRVLPDVLPHKDIDPTKIPLETKP